MKESVEVDCTFAANGQVRVRRLRRGDRWESVEQGRQWFDEAGRHVLVMLPGGGVSELVLSLPDLQWYLSERPGGQMQII